MEINPFEGYAEATPVPVDTNVFNPGMGNPPASFSFGNLLTNPTFQTAMLQVAAAMDPNGIGGRVAKAGLAMRQAGSMAQGMGAAQDTATGQQPPVQQGGQAPPVQQPAGGNVVETAKQFGTMGKALKDLYAIDPNNVPAGYQQNLVSALNATPRIENPTQPVGNVMAGDPTGVPLSGSPALALDPSLAMSMTPEQIHDIYQHNVAKDAVDIARRKETWNMDPARYQEDLTKAIAPGITQAVAQLEVHKQKQMFDISTADDWIAKNPQIAGLKFENSPMTYGQLYRMSAGNKEGADAITGLIKADVDMKRTKIAVQGEIDAARIRAQETGSSVQFTKEMALVEKFNADIVKFEKGVPVDEWNKLTPAEQNTKSLLGIVPQTMAMQEARDVAIKMRNQIMTKWAPSYKDYISAEAQAASLLGKPGSNKVVADQSRLDKLIEDDRKNRGTTRSFAPATSVFEMFNPNGGSI